MTRRADLVCEILFDFFDLTGGTELVEAEAGATGEWSVRDEAAVDRRRQDFLLILGILHLHVLGSRGEAVGLGGFLQTFVVQHPLRHVWSQLLE